MQNAKHALLTLEGSTVMVIIRLPLSKLLYISKAVLPQVGILFGTQFPSLGIFISKKVGFRKN